MRTASALPVNSSDWTVSRGPNHRRLKPNGNAKMIMFIAYRFAVANKRTIWRTVVTLNSEWRQLIVALNAENRLGTSDLFRQNRHVTEAGNIHMWFCRGGCLLVSPNSVCLQAGLESLRFRESCI